MRQKTETRGPSCASCREEPANRICMTEQGSASKGCPTVASQDLLKDANKAYDRPEIKEFARQASIQEAECYANRHQRPYVMQPTKTRIVEICEFAKKMGYERLGLAFCVGLAEEARIVEGVLRDHGFEVFSAVCKAGRTPKSLLGLTVEETIFHDRDEAMCNPVYQASLLNQANCDFNIVLGLCVGHDSLFFMHAKAPTTVLAAKDRITGHNPLAAIYLSGSYYRKISNPDIP